MDFPLKKVCISFLPLYNPKLRYKKSIDYSRLLGYIFNFLPLLFCLNLFFISRPYLHLWDYRTSDRKGSYPTDSTRHQRSNRECPSVNPERVKADRNDSYKWDEKQNDKKYVTEMSKSGWVNAKRRPGHFYYAL